MDKKKKIAGIALAIAVFLIIGARICYVTAHARLPEQNVIAQGDSLTYRGLTYQIKGAVLWNYEDYFKEHPEYQSYGCIYSEEASGSECVGNDAFNSVFPCI